MGNPIKKPTIMTALLYLKTHLIDTYFWLVTTQMKKHRETGKNTQKNLG